MLAQNDQQAVAEAWGPLRPFNLPVQFALQLNSSRWAGVGDGRTRARDMRGFGSEMSVVVDFDRIVYWRAPLRRQHLPIKTDRLPYTEIVPMYGLADGHLIKAALDHGAKRLVIQGLGWGDVNKPMYAAIKDAIVRDVPVVITSRVPNGRVLPNYGWEGGGKSLVDAGAVISDDLSARKARILLMLLL